MISLCTQRNFLHVAVRQQLMNVNAVACATYYSISILKVFDFRTTKMYYSLLFRQ